MSEQSADYGRRHTPTEHCPMTHPMLLDCAICRAETERIRADKNECALEDLLRALRTVEQQRDEALRIAQALVRSGDCGKGS